MSKQILSFSEVFLTAAPKSKGWYNSIQKYTRQRSSVIGQSVDSTGGTGWIFGPFPIIQFLEFKFQVSLFGHD